MEPKVSIITSCYNGARYVDRWKNSILNQSFNNIEILIINDGSTDTTDELLLSCQQDFESRGYSFRYFEQENKGVSAAVNVGLQNMTGDYFMNYDIDDMLEPWCISERVEFLERNRDCGMVLSNGWYVKDDDVEKKYPLERRARIWSELSKQKEKEWVFKKRLLGMQGTGVTPYMYRTNYYLKMNPKRTIPNIPYAQDDMLFLLNSYAYLCGYIEKPSYRYVDCKSSLSKELDNPKTRVQRLIDTYEANIKSIDMLPISNFEKEKYKIAIIRILGSSFYGSVVETDRKYIPHKVLVFGSGKRGIEVLNVLKSCGVVVDSIIDNDSRKWGGVLDGIEIVSIEQIGKKFKEMVTVIAVDYNDDIKKQLKDFGAVENIDYYDYRNFMSCCRYELMEKLYHVDALSMR